MKKILLLAALLLAPAILRGEDWPQFRGPGGKAVSSETDLPVKWSKTEGLRWKAELPGRGLSNPVIAKGRVYLTCSSGYREGRLHVLCFEEATGKKLWERQFASTGNTACHPKTNMAAPTPVTDGDNVYALWATGDLAALDRDGNLLWYRSLVGDYPKITNQVGMASSPVLVGTTLLLPLENAGDSFAAGIDVKTGKNKWKVARSREINWVTPVVVESGNRTAAVFHTPGEATGYDPETGKVMWTHKGDTGLSSILSSVVGEGVIYVPGGNLAALEPQPEGKAPKVLWQTSHLKSAYSSPLYYKGRLYNITGVGVTCVNTKDGELAWTQRLTGPFSASPVVADGKLYAVNEKGQTAVVKLGEKPEVLARNDLDDVILATPAIANGAIYLRSDKYLYCIGGKK